MILTENRDHQNEDPSQKKKIQEKNREGLHVDQKRSLLESDHRQKRGLKINLTPTSDRGIGLHPERKPSEGLNHLSVKGRALVLGPDDDLHRETQGAEIGHALNVQSVATIS